LMIGGTQMPPSVINGKRDAVVWQVRWCASGYVFVFVGVSACLSVSRIS